MIKTMINSGLPKRERHAALTVVRNERHFLPIWFDYYSKHLGAENIFVIDNDTDDDSLEYIKGRANVLKRSSEYSWDGRWRCMIRKKMTWDLLKIYDSVVLVDVDEIVFPNPSKYSNIRDYLNKFNGDFVCTNSWEIIQGPNEPRIDLSKPILSQRSFWVQADSFWGKTAVIRSNIDVRIHRTIDNPGNIIYDKNLYLLHLSKMDSHISLQRNLERLKTEKKIDKKRCGGHVLNVDPMHHIKRSCPSSGVFEIPFHIKDSIPV